MLIEFADIRVVSTQYMLGKSAHNRDRRCSTYHRIKIPPFALI